MKLKYFLRGLGIGVIVTTIILTVSHIDNRKMSDSEIIERAQLLGMGFIHSGGNSTTEETKDTTSESTHEESTHEESTHEESTDEESTDEESTDEENANEESTREDSSSYETTIADEESDVETSSEDDYAIENLNTEASNEMDSNTDTENNPSDNKGSEETTQGTTEESIQETTQDTTEESTQETTQETTGTADTKDDASTDIVYCSVNIIRGMSSNMVADILKQNGIIDDAKEFDAFLISKGYAEHIRVGTFSLNSGMTYDEIADIILGNN